MKILATIIIAGGLATAGQAAAQPGPSELVESAAQSMLDGLEAIGPPIGRIHRRSVSSSRSTCCRTSIFHTRPAWCSARTGGTRTPEQRQRFADAFYHTLSTTTAARSSTSPATASRCSRPTLEAETDRATVRTEVTAQQRREGRCELQPA